MRVLVTVKPVADPNTPPTAWIMAQQGQAEGVNLVANHFDLIAVEQAVRMRDQGVTDICLVMVAGEGAIAQLRSAIALGADRTVVIDPEGRRLDWYQIAAVVRRVVDEERPDLVLMGKQATDDDAAQVGPILAHLLGWPQVTFVSEMAFSADKKWVRAGRETDDGVEVVDVRLPAVMTCDLRLNEPRYPTLPNLVKSKRTPMRRIKFGDLGVVEAPRVSVESYRLPLGRSGQIQFVRDAAELAEVLRERKLVG